MLGSQVPGARAYASQEQDSVSFVTITLRPIIYKLEEAFGRLLTPISPNAFLKFNMEGLLRGDIQSRYAAYSQGVQAGFLSINDIRRLEDLRNVEGGDVMRVPLSHVDLAAANIVETDKRVGMAVRLISVGFNPIDVLSSLGLPAMDHTGLPTVQLQNAAQVGESGVDVEELYLGARDYDPENIVNALTEGLRSLPAPVVNVNVPEAAPRTRNIERDTDGNITKIVEN
jgi:hypothetical protein